MSQQIPFQSVSQEQNVFVRYQKIPQEKKNIIRSGILERYTYKTDNGELLKTPIIHTVGTSNKYTSELIPINRKSQNSSGESSNFCKSNLPTRNKAYNNLGTPIRSYVHHIVHTNVPIATKMGNSSKANDEKVRTEHCDSTTDILENFDIKSSNLFVSPSKQSDESNTRRNSWKSSQDSKVESDSDCEIIDVKISGSNDSRVSKNKSRCPIALNDKAAHNLDKNVMPLINLDQDIESLKTKVLDWMAIKPVKKPQPVIHSLISDESDDDDDEFLCDKTGLKSKTYNNKLKNKSENILVSTSSRKVLGKETIDKCGASHRTNESEKSNISIILQKQDHATKYQTYSKENVSSYRPSDARQTIIIQKKDHLQLINEKYYKMKAKLSRDFKSPVMSSPSNSPPKQCSNILEKALLKKSPSTILKRNENELTPANIQKLNVQSQKMNAPLSPESMKSEFYNYLKINTNPSAQKAETIAKNRRSTRVKNLILQIERNKEQQQSVKIKNEAKKKERANEIRKKFMKYSKPNVVFPGAPSNCYQFADFDPVIEAFLNEKTIPSKLHQAYSDDDDDKSIDTVIIKKEFKTLNKEEEEEEDGKHLKRKYIHKKKQELLKVKNRMLKKKRRKQIVTKMIGCTPHVSDIKLRRLRFKPNRIFRDSSVRITRHSLDGYKVMPRKTRVRKSKLNSNLKKKKVKTLELIKEKENEVSIQEEEEEEEENEIKKDIEIVASPESTLRLRDIKSLLPECKANVEAKLTITEAAKCNPLELKLQKPEPKLTIREVSTIKTETKPKEMNTMLNKLTIREVKHSANDFGVNNIKELEVEVDIPTSSLATQIGTVSPNNILLPNLLASKLSFALTRNLPKAKTNEHKNQIFTLNCLKNEESRYLIGMKKTEDQVDDSPNRNRALSPVCFGFEPDEKSAKICKIMQEVVSNLDTDIMVTSRSPIQTPEPIEHLVPEIRINSIPMTNEPCNLQEVMSIVSSQDLTPMLQHEDTSSDYSEASSAPEQEETEIALGDLVDPSLIEKSNSNVIPLNQNIKTKSFHRSLMQSRVKQKSFLDVYRSNVFEHSDSDSSMATPKVNPNKKSLTLTHGIDINAKGGAMFTTYYINGILIIVQEFMITFWKQTALGNILGAQNMWLPNGSLQRIILERGCINRRSSEMVLTCESSVAYIELWTKQHESKFRECPIADVFATIYFHRGHGIPDKKVLQLENIKGYGHDVRFVVIKSSREIIVSWCDTFAEPIKTLVRCYQLAPDFQTVSSVKEIECINHCLISLHNIQDCDDLILGAGNEQISVWNLRHGYLVTTLNLADNTIQSSLENKSLLLYAQCDTGFLFLIQQIEVGVLRLVAVNGMTQEWKQLQSYQVPPNYKELLGIIVESGVLMTCYTNGFLCWNMNNGQILAEIEMVDNIVLPTNKYLVAFKNYQVKVQHIMSYILTHDW